MRDLPTGVVTFLFTDVEGSTRLWETHPHTTHQALARHDQLVETLVAQHHGVCIRPRAEGDSHFVVFPRASDAVAAAVALQRALHEEAWPLPTPLRVRMALHTGEADLRGGDYYGAAVNRCARLRSAAHGGQVLLTEATQAVAEDGLPEGVQFRDLGEHRLMDLQRPSRIFQVVAPGLQAAFPPLRSLGARSTNLPVQTTPFIGRQREIAALRGMLLNGEVRLLTLAGPGGIGKTRLALQVAADVLEAYRDGVWLVELAALADPKLVPKAVASVLEIAEHPGRSMGDTLVDALRTRTLLLLLDNCEHLLAACAQLADALLRSSAHLRILATSREALKVPGEAIRQVPPLSLPEAGNLRSHEHLSRSEAGRLFIERAALALPHFAVTQSNATGVAQIVARLDGIPLAIELAAARAKVLTVEQIAARLDDRFRLLTGGSRTASPRHQTLRAAMDWSYDLLSEPERAVLRRLSVFAGGCTLGAAEAACAGRGVDEPDVLDLLTLLVDKSLVIVETQGEEARYRLLETIRQFGRDRLQEAGESTDIRRRHRDWHLSLAEQAAPNLRGPDSVRWFTRLGTDYDNLRIALEWSKLEAGADAGLRMAGALAWFWRVRGYWNEGQRWLEEAIDRSGHVPSPALVDAFVGGAWLAYLQGDDPQTTALCERGLDVCRDLGDTRRVPDLLGQLAYLARYQLDFDRARALWEESLSLARAFEDKWRTSMVLGNLGTLAWSQGNDDQWAALHLDSYRLSKEVGEKWLIALAAADLGEVAFDAGDHARAAMLFREAITFKREVGCRRPGDYPFYAVAALAAKQGHYERAAWLLSPARPTDTGRRYPVRRSPRRQAWHDQLVSSLHAALGAEAFDEAWEEGRAMTVEQGVECALDETGRS